MAEPLHSLDVGQEASRVFGENTVLVKLSFGVPPAFKQDKRVSRAVAREYKAREKSAKVLKEVYPYEALEPLIKLESEGRTYHYEHTLPWLDNGWRIVKARRLEEHHNRLLDVQHRFDRERSAFLRDLGVTLDGHRANLGGLWSPQDRDRYRALPSKVYCTIDIRPTPVDSDFRCSGIPEHIASTWRQQQEHAMAEALNAAKREVWERVHDAVGRMATTLRDPRARFTGTLVSDLGKLADILPGLNVDDDPALTDMARKLRRELATYDPERLRDTPAVRAEAQQSAERVMQDVKGALDFFMQ